MLRNAYVIEHAVPIRATDEVCWEIEGVYSIKQWALSTAKELAVHYGGDVITVTRYRLDRADIPPVVVFHSANQEEVVEIGGEG